MGLCACMSAFLSVRGQASGDEEAAGASRRGVAHVAGVPWFPWPPFLFVPRPPPPDPMATPWAFLSILVLPPSGHLGIEALVTSVPTNRCGSHCRDIFMPSLLPALLHPLC